MKYVFYEVGNGARTFSRNTLQIHGKGKKNKNVKIRIGKNWTFIGKEAMQIFMSGEIVIR